MEDRETERQTDLKAVAVEHALNRSASQAEHNGKDHCMHTSLHGA